MQHIRTRGKNIALNSMIVDVNESIHQYCENSQNNPVTLMQIDTVFHQVRIVKSIYHAVEDHVKQHYAVE